ncbi:MAG: phosphate ABC transporter permease subunit PstC, partial [Zetaproteobacteria bacterium CG_4_8_14_3_um_filter_59_5]
MNSGNVILWILGGLLPLCAIAFFLTRNRMTHREVAGLEVFSRPGYYGWLSVIYI